MNKRIWIGAVCLLLTACSHKQAEQSAMQPQLESIRVKIEQSALMAADAACAGGGREALVEAAAVMNRRAMGGPEMAKVHKMMGMQQGESGGMSMQEKPGLSSEMRQHIALHDAGEAVFDLLEDVSAHKLTCRQVSLVHLAADAALLREAGGTEPVATSHTLDARISARLASGQLAESVKFLTLALRKI